MIIYILYTNAKLINKKNTLTIYTCIGLVKIKANLVDSNTVDTFINKIKLLHTILCLDWLNKRKFSTLSVKYRWLIIF